MARRTESKRRIGRGESGSRAVTGLPARFTLDRWDVPRWDAPSGGPD
jgi:hypothetical protein